MPGIDQNSFRNVLSSFATGITVITAFAEDGRPLGLTANSFTSVSLEPPLVLWCLDYQTESCDDFVRAENFSVHVLHAEQQNTSDIFARRNGKKFDEINWQNSDYDTPVLDDYLSCLHCRTEHQYEGGDHVIIVGRVLGLELPKEKPPLIYYQGKYDNLA